MRYTVQLISKIKSSLLVGLIFFSINTFAQEQIDSLFMVGRDI